jgi:radical SAM protein with 4Fe4S-binding SPASM domain
MSNILSKAKRAVKMYINPELCRPKSARIIITANCNFRCQMCTFWKEKHQDPSLELIKYWIKELADFRIEEIDLGGGEPFLRKDLPEIVKEIKSQGMKCSLTTNGWLVNEDSFPPLDSCEISIDGAKPETHDKIRGIKGAWQRAIQAVEIAKSHCPTKINFVIQSDNYLEITDYCQLAKKLGVGVTLIPVSLKLAAQPWISNSLSQYNIPLLEKQIASALKSGVILNNREFLRTFLAKLKKGPLPQKCLAPFRCLLIFVNGDVYPCGNFDVAVDNFTKEKRLEDIYRNYKNWRKKIWSGTHPFCQQCVYTDIATRETLQSAVIPYIKKSLKEIWQK